MPVIFPDHVTHSQVKIEGEDVEVFSAGFLNINSIGLAEVLPEGSESLNKMPSELDKDILNRALMNAGTMFFLDFNLL